MEELKKQLIDICNSSELPLEAILYVTKDLWRDVQDTYNQYKLTEQMEKNKESEE